MKPLDILLVEDHYIMRKFMENYLSKYHVVTSKPNGLEAIKWLESGNRPNIMIIDLSMPGMDGKDFIDYVKCTEFFSHIPILLVSGQSEEELKGLADDYLIKPFNPSELNFKIESLLKKPVLL
jgi:CheY-like chemotaxis protein